MHLGDVLTDVYTQANAVHDALTRAGLPEPAASYALYQAYHETGAFKSPLYLQHNNASGIMFAGQNGATKGTNGYAWFATLDDWAHAMQHEATKKANPAGATSLEDYVHRLKANGYFTDTEANYVEGVKRARLILKDLPAEGRAGLQPDGSTQATQDLDIPGSKNYVLLDKEKSALDWAKKNPIPATGIALVGLLILGKIFGR